MRATLHFDLPNEQDRFLDAVNGSNYRNAIRDLQFTLDNIHNNDQLQEEHDLDPEQIGTIQALIDEALRMNGLPVDFNEEYG